MPQVTKTPIREMDDSALVTFHDVEDQYPGLAPSDDLNWTMDPFAPVPATAPVEPTNLEDAA